MKQRIFKYLCGSLVIEIFHILPTKDLLALIHKRQQQIQDSLLDNDLPACIVCNCEWKLWPYCLFIFGCILSLSRAHTYKLLGTFDKNVPVQVPNYPPQNPIWGSTQDDGPGYAFMQVHFFKLLDSMISNRNVNLLEGMTICVNRTIIRFSYLRKKLLKKFLLLHCASGWKW